MASLLPHILRVNYIARRDKSYTADNPALPPVSGNGWVMENQTYTPVICLSPPAPKAVIELTKCGCKKGCRGKCSCRRNALPCTPLYKCGVDDCDNMTRIDDMCGDGSDEDSEDGYD